MIGLAPSLETLCWSLMEQAEKVTDRIAAAQREESGNRQLAGRGRACGGTSARAVRRGGVLIAWRLRKHLNVPVGGPSNTICFIHPTIVGVGFYDINLPSSVPNQNLVRRPPAFPTTLTPKANS